MFAQIPALLDLNCGSNLLTSLDVSRNTVLTSLNIGLNQLTAIDVHANPELIYLECYNNHLTCLDVSQNTRLTSLACYSNRLTVSSPFDLSAFPAAFNLSKTSNWTGGSLSGTVLTAAGKQVTYDYDCGLGKKMTVTLDIEVEIDPDTTVPIDASAFPDSVFRSYVSETIDDGDGILTQTELESVKEVILTNQGVSSLKGIELFGNLRYLYCGSNALTEMDVTRNPALTVLSCESNQLTSLVVRRNTVLQELYCENNQLISLDITQNRDLTSLNCDANRLTSLDVTMNPALTSLSCESNQLTSLDVSQCERLLYLYCGKNQQTVAFPFDLSGLPGSFDAGKTANWVGGTVSGTVLESTAETVTFDYDCGNGHRMTVALHREKRPAPVWDYVLPSDLKIIEENAFASVSASSVLIPDGCTAIGPCAFAGSSLTLIYIPSTVTSIAEDALPDNVTICTVPGSYAETWGHDNGFTVETKE